MKYKIYNVIKKVTRYRRPSECDSHPTADQTVVKKLIRYDEE